MVEIECPEPDGNRNVPDFSVTLPDAHAAEYYVTTCRHALSKRQQWYRFFERAAFGPSPDMFDNDLGYVDAQGLPKPHESFGEWMKEQNALPATPHRKYFRKWHNPRFLKMYKYGRKGPHPCALHIRWRNFSFMSIGRRAARRTTV